MKHFISLYLPGYLGSLVYMLQSSEYKPGNYLKWYHRTKNFRVVAKRKELVLTKKAKLLKTLLRVMAILLVLLAVFLFIYGLKNDSLPLVLVGIIVFCAAPWILAYGILLPLFIGQIFIQRPKERRLVAEATAIIAKHPGYKIAIAGSFGKTTAKEVLKTILAEDKKVAATPGNMNTPVGISRFAQKLQGDEEVLIFELGESHVGDVAKLCQIVKPDLGIITGINEAHLETFKTIENTVATIFELQDFLNDKPLYKNGESDLVNQKVPKNDSLIYSRHGVNGWRVSEVKSSIKGLSFTLKKNGKVVWANVKLLGEHNIGILAACTSIADNLGLSVNQIAEGLKKIQPFEHRMQPKKLHGAWIIDDTYNGNTEGVEAGIWLLKNLKAKRRIYVTPGLVEQGKRSSEIHQKIGRLLASVADVVVLMQNSVLEDIAKGLQEKNFKGQLTIIDDPLEFYTHLEQFVAAGDVVLMQNDWTDNYA